jgi:hypothetical protein
MFVAVQPGSAATATLGITSDGVKSGASTLMGAASTLGGMLQAGSAKSAKSG